MAATSTLVLLSACGKAPAPYEPGAAFQNPPAFQAYVWTWDTLPVGWDVVDTSAGPEHCVEQHATFMFLGWPPGNGASSAAQGRFYVRDPGHTLAAYWQDRLRSSLDLHATLPPGSSATGLTYGSLQIFLGPDRGARAVYVVGLHTAERWPRVDPMFYCS